MKLFYAMKDESSWEHHYRLGTCTPGGPEFVTLEPADLIAYETFRYLHGKHFRNTRVREVISSMFKSNGFLGFYYEESLFERIKEPLEKASVVPNGFIVLLPTSRDKHYTVRGN